VNALAEVVQASPLPVLAVGGISSETVPRLTGTGCAGYAAIGWFADEDLTKG
jgi:thiamine monophosphate synthase